MRYSNVFPNVPPHNNNQPFVNLNLVVQDLQIGHPEEPSTTVYSLFENQQENVQFLPNEYGFVELLDDEEEEEEERGDPIISCVSCGHFGVKQDFFDEQHCTYDCSVINGIACNRITIPRSPVVNPFKINDVMEAIDPEHQSLFCPVVVVEKLGFRILLKFIGFHDKYNFWVNADSINVFPVNWTTRYKASELHFHGPVDFNWTDYLSKTPEATVPDESLFKHISNDLENTAPVTVGMKLEAVDVRNTSLICVATVTGILGERFLVHFDSWDSLYDYWTTLDSPFVKCVGFARVNRLVITPPHHYESPEEFDWDEYVTKTNSVRVPPQVFREYRPRGFQVGQQVEVIDKRSPRLLRVATIKAMRDYGFVTITFSSLTSAYDYDVYEYSEDVHALGYGESTCHPLAHVPSDPGSCPNHKVCYSLSNSKGGEFHDTVKNCPYFVTVTFTDRVVVFEDKYFGLGNVTYPTKSEIVTWDFNRIGAFVFEICKNINSAQFVADAFKNNLIDGESFLMLTQQDITDALCVKLGPAVKIHNIIQFINS